MRITQGARRRVRRAADRVAKSAGLRPDPLTAPITRLPPWAEAYRSLAEPALLFDRIDFADRRRSLVLLLPTINPEKMTAGPVTALRFACTLADRLGLPVRVITTNPEHGTSRVREAEEAVRRRLSRPDLRFDHVGPGGHASVNPHDIWVATLWQTAVAADVAARCGVLDRSRVVYLVQDYEPAFSPWSSKWAAAQATYDAGFHLVVNSLPLADYLRDVEGVIVDRDLVLAPALDYPRLERVAAARVDGPPSVFCYARPRAARNLYPTAIAAVRRAATRTSEPFNLLLAGEDGIATPSIPGIRIENLGQVSYGGYYELMQRSTVALSLMMSPHPSHPPLDWAVSGGWAVTNTFGSARDGLHPRLIAARADPDNLGDLLADVLGRARPEPFAPLARDLGRPMQDVVDALAGVLGRESRAKT